jgi:hypothetical protein
VWEVRVDSVLKLDRAAKRESSADSHVEVPAEGHRRTRSAKVYTQLCLRHKTSVRGAHKIATSRRCSVRDVKQLV